MIYIYILKSVQFSTLVGYFMIAHCLQQQQRMCFTPDPATEQSITFLLQTVQAQKTSRRLWTGPIWHSIMQHHQWALMC